RPSACTVLSGSSMRMRRLGRGKYSVSERPLIDQSPFPGRRSTRATAVFRRPTVWTCFSSAMSSSDFEGFGLLALMRMLGPRIDLQLLHHVLAQGVLGHHSLDRHLDHPLGVLGE